MRNESYHTSILHTKLTRYIETASNLNVSDLFTGTTKSWKCLIVSSFALWCGWSSRINRSADDIVWSIVANEIHIVPSIFLEIGNCTSNTIGTFIDHCSKVADFPEKIFKFPHKIHGAMFHLQSWRLIWFDYVHIGLLIFIKPPLHRILYSWCIWKWFWWGTLGDILSGHAEFYCKIYN